MSSIALCMNTLDERSNLRAVFNCVSKIVDEIIVVDTGSTDGTQELARKLGARVYQIDGVPGYGEMRTLTVHLARTDWALILDGDERMDLQDVCKLPELAKSDNDLIWLPRQHYRSWDRSMCENPDIRQYADWQARFVRVKPSIYWVRKVHEQIRGVSKDYRDYANPVIRHFGWLKTDARKQMIVDMCNRLHKEDEEYRDTYILENRLGCASGETYWQSTPEYHSEHVDAETKC